MGIKPQLITHAFITAIMRDIENMYLYFVSL